MHYQSLFRTSIALSLCLLINLVVSSTARLIPAHADSQSPHLTAPGAGSGNLKIKQRNPVVNEANRITLSATDADGHALDGVAWSSGSPDIAQIDSQTGVVNGIIQGFATVTASRGGESASVFVVVARVRKGVGQTVPGDTKVDRGGQLYISNPQQNVILKASEALTSVTQVYAGQQDTRGLRNGDTAQSLFAGPTALGVDNTVRGGIYVADTLNHSIRRINFTNQVETILGTGSPGITSFDGNGLAAFEQAQFSSPRGLAVENGGNLFVADSDNHAIYYLNFAKRQVLLLAGQPGIDGKQDGDGRKALFSHPAGIGLSADGRILIVADQGNHRVRLLGLMRTDDGNYTCTVATIGVASSARGVKLSEVGVMDQAADELVFNKPNSVSFDSAGNINVVDATSAYVITRPFGQKPELVDLAQPAVSFSQAVSVTIRGTESFVLDAQATTPEEAVKVVTVGGPEIESLSKETVRVEGGEEVIITGKNFAPETLVVLGDAPVTDLTVESATRITFRTPKQKIHGDRTLTVQTRGGVAQRKLAVIPKPLSELADGEITTVAGGLAYVGDGGTATKAAFYNLESVALDSSGNLFVADAGNNRIRRMDVNTGVITTIAGNGNEGLSGDNSPAAGAGLFYPNGVAMDGFGNLFIADALNHRVRRVDAVTGIITTVAGGGSILGDGVLATDAAISPNGLTLDSSGNLLIAEMIGNRIRRVDAQTHLITTLAGNGKQEFSGDGGLAVNAGLAGPSGLTIDNSGNLLIADTFNHRIRRVDAKTGIITAVAGNGNRVFGGDGGPAVNAGLSGPKSIAVDSVGNLLIADTENCRVRRVDVTSGVITTVAGNGSLGFGGDGGLALKAFITPESIALDGFGNLLIADFYSDHVRRVDAKTSIITTVAGGGITNATGLATSVRMTPIDVSLDSVGNLLITDDFNRQISRVEVAANHLARFAGNGSNRFSGDGGPAIQAGMVPGGLAGDASGNLFIADFSRIRRIDGKTGIIKTIAGSGKGAFSGDSGPAKRAGMSPLSVIVDHEGNVFLSEFANNRIRKIDAKTKIITTVAGNGKMEFSGDGGPANAAGVGQPGGMALDQAGNLFFADGFNHRIRRIDAKTGLISTVAGNGQYGFSGDGGPAIASQLFTPHGVVFDKAGNLFIADSGNSRVRRVDARTGIITTVAGSENQSFGGDGGSATQAGCGTPSAWL